MGPPLGTVRNLSYFYLLKHIIIIPILLLPFKPPLLSFLFFFFHTHRNPDPQGSLATWPRSYKRVWLQSPCTSHQVVLLPSYFKGVSNGEVPGRSQEREGFQGKKAPGQSLPVPSSSPLHHNFSCLSLSQRFGIQECWASQPFFFF